MMRAGINDPKKPTVIVGLSEGNIVRLKNDQPIRADFHTFGVDLPGQLVICYGETELELKRQLKRGGLIGPETKGETDTRLMAEDEIRERHTGDRILICTVGLPRSGKSIWAKSQAWPIVNPDSVRLAIHGERFIAIAEPYVWATVRAMVRALFLAGHNKVILDACNNSHKRRDEWRTDEWATFFKYFDAPPPLQNRMSKHDRIRQYILSGEPLTQLDALHLFGSFRLSSDISRLKEEGLNIATELIPTEDGCSRYARYQLVKEEEFTLT